MDKTIVRVAVGLALEAELERESADSRVLNRPIALYAAPDMAAVEALPDQLVVSESLEDREVGLWFELGLKHSFLLLRLINSMHYLERRYSFYAHFGAVLQWTQLISSSILNTSQSALIHSGIHQNDVLC